jgi:hypothetical protein
MTCRASNMARAMRRDACACARCGSPTCTWARRAARPRRCWTSCAVWTARRCTWWATSSTAGSCAAAGTGRRRTTTWCKSCCARRARARTWSSCRATTTSLRASTWATTSAASTWWTRACTSPPTAALWVTHGDYFDGVIQCAKWLAYVGDWAYELGAQAQPPLQLRATARAPGPAVLELSRYLKLKVKRAVSYVSDFEGAVAREARGAA